MFFFQDGGLVAARIQGIQLPYLVAQQIQARLAFARRLLQGAPLFIERLPVVIGLGQVAA